MHRVKSDVVIVGARAAGAATALLLARLGHDVVVLDRALLPSDTLSTHSISRSGVAQLHRWGLLDEVMASGAPPIRRVTFHTPDGSMSREVKDRAGVDHLVAPRRHVLDTIVARAAAEAGADLRLGTTVTGVARDIEGRVTGVRALGAEGPVLVDARVVVGADGLRSGVARAVGAPVVDERPPGSATFYTYYGGVAWDGVEFFLRPGSLAGVFPTHGGEACIWVCVPPAAALAARRRAGSVEGAFAALLADTAPELAARLARAPRTEPVRGTTRLPNQARQAWARAGRWSATRSTTATPSPGTGSATPTATPSRWPRRSTPPCGASGPWGRRSRATAAGPPSPARTSSPSRAPSGPSRPSTSSSTCSGA